MRAIKLLLVTCSASILFFSCDKTEVEDFEVPDLAAEYLPLQVGKYITYQLDSTVFKNFGTVEEIHSYQEKNEIMERFTDLLNRPSYKVYRYLRDKNGTTPWTYSSTYYITPAADKIELVENNLRFIKLYLPQSTDVTWKGNKFLPDQPYFSYGYITGIDFWDYKYNGYETLKLNNVNYDNVLVMKAIDESLNLPITASTDVASRTLYIDKYAKNIGLVYQEFTLWEYQSKRKVGFGVKRSMIDHN